MLRDLLDMPWIGGDDVFDLSNTVVLSGVAGEPDVDFFADDALLGSWRSRVSNELGALSLAELSELREAVRAAFDALDRGSRVPRAARAALNVRAATAPVALELNAADELVYIETVDDPVGRVAREVLRIAADHARVIRRCGAPSCGMFFEPKRTDQAWCSPRCGTRARAARLREAKRSARELAL